MTTKTLNDKDLQAHYEDIFAMLGTPGWARLQTQLEDMIDSYNTVAGIETLEQLWHRKGELAQMLWLKSLRETHEAAYNELLAQQDGDGGAAETTGGKARVVEPERGE